MSRYHIFIDILFFASTLALYVQLQTLYEPFGRWKRWICTLLCFSWQAYSLRKESDQRVLL